MSQNILDKLYSMELKSCKSKWDDQATEILICYNKDVTFTTHLIKTKNGNISDPIVHLIKPEVKLNITLDEALEKCTNELTLMTYSEYSLNKKPI